MRPEVKGALIAVLVMIGIVLCLGVALFGERAYEIIRALILYG